MAGCHGHEHVSDQSDRAVRLPDRVGAWLHCCEEGTMRQQLLPILQSTGRLGTEPVGCSPVPCKLLKSYCIKQSVCWMAVCSFDIISCIVYAHQMGHGKSIYAILLRVKVSRGRMLTASCMLMLDVGAVSMPLAVARSMRNAGTQAFS
jgi:hypothetical protein